MLRNQRFLPVALTFFAATFSVFAMNIFADELQTFAGKDATGKETTFYALQLNPQQLAEKAPATEPASRQIAVVVDTSASQFGEHRRVSLATVRDALANLKPTDQVQLFASDTNAVAMTPLPVAPNSPEMQVALKKLEGRVPLGATDMRKTVDKVADSFSARSDAPKSILYIGEGTSRAKLMNTKSFENALKKLSDSKISFNSMAIGPRLDLRVLGSFAAHTGGVMMRDTGRENSYGKELASTTDATVYWPTAPPAPTAGTTVAENFMPPIRSDRNAVLVGTCTNDKATVEGTFAAPDGTEIKATFTATAKPETTNYYLKELVDEVTFNGGLTVPLFDTSSLNVAKESISAKSDAIENKARKAFLQKDLQTAKMLAQKALEIDDRQAAAREILDKIDEANGVEIIDNSTAPTSGAGGGVMADGGLDMMGGPDMLGNEERARQIDAQVIQTDVTNRLNEARGLAKSDPEDAIQKLRDTQEFIRANQGHLSPEVRNQLYNNTESTLKAAQRIKASVDRNMQELQERIAARTEQQQLLKKLTRDQRRIEQLSRTFDSLMREGKYTAAETGPAAELAGMLPESPLPRVATLTSRTASYHYANQQLKVQRQRAVVRTMMQVEKSHMPFPDEPPIVYPDSERWERISASREKYKNMDLSGRKTCEKETRIKEALDDDTEVEYDGAELKEVMQDLKDKHGIEIVIDTGKIEDFTPITMSLKGVSLRSALKLMLKEADATYVIRDEVLLITTDEEANKELTTKVYPVADLVIPIETPDFQGGFGGMGGMGSGLFGNGDGGNNGPSVDMLPDGFNF